MCRLDIWLTRLPRPKILLSLALILDAPFMCAQVESGTVVIVGYSKKVVIVAADSRETDGHGAYRDEACKIAALNDNLIFTAAGQARSILNGTVLWDATREAKAAIADTQRQNSDNVGDFLDRVAGKWGILLGANVAANIGPDELLKLSDDQEIVNGMFIGLDENQELHISHEIIRVRIVQNVPKIGVDSVKVTTIPDNAIFRALGEGDISDEFEIGRSLRSKRWRLEVPRFAREHRISNEAAEAILRVDLTGAYGKDRVPNNPNVQLVGGKTDAVELKRGGTVHWIQRKSQCSKN
jgi:hypothetical protein